MTSDSEFNTIRPYCDSEIEAAIERLCKSEEFLTLFTHLTKMDRATIQGALQGIRSRAEFQAKFFGPAIQSLINTTTDGITVSGMELVDKNTSYIFMSNHRDIILDSGFLSILLVDEGMDTVEIAIGERYNSERNAYEFGSPFKIYPGSHRRKRRFGMDRRTGRKN